MMSAIKRGQLKPGAVLKVLVDHRPAYLHFLGKHPEYGDAVRVLGFTAPVGSEEEMRKAVSRGYVTFYPATTAVNQELAVMVGEWPSDLKIPTVFRRAGARAKNGEVLTWVIEENGSETVVKDLTEDLRSLPIASIWNHEALCLRIREDWRPEMEG